jgi:hypothetical protein
MMARNPSIDCGRKIDTKPATTLHSVRDGVQKAGLMDGTRATIRCATIHPPSGPSQAIRYDIGAAAMEPSA